jgi:hypothetical protein
MTAPNRAQRRRAAVSTRKDRVARFRATAGPAGYDTSLLAAGSHRPCDGGAILNWHLTRDALKPSCFVCHVQFSNTLEPAAFLTATSIKMPQAGVAVSAACENCWKKSPETIESAAVDCLRKNLGVSKFAED